MSSMVRGRMGLSVFTRHMMLAGTALGLVAASPAIAQTAAPAASASARSFNIPSQPLRDALHQLMQQGSLQIGFEAADVDGKTSPGVSGAINTGEALSRLLAGTGLTFRYLTAGSVVLEPAPQSADGAIQLGPVRVEGDVGSGSYAGLAPSITSDPLATEGTRSYAARGTKTATGLTLTQRETPQTVSVITRQEMDDFNLTTINDVLRNTPGVSTQTYTYGLYQYRVRGFGVTNFQLDGLPTFYDVGYDGGQTSNSMAMYDRVEVIKGAGGLMSAAGDPGGIINLIRKKPTRNFQGHVSLGIASWSDFQGEVDLGGPLNEAGTVRARAVAFVRDQDSYLDHYHSKSQMLYGVIEADLSPTTLLTVGANWQDTTPKGSANGGIPLLDSNGNFNDVPRSFNPGARWGTLRSTNSSVFATLEHRFANDWTLKLHGTHRYNKFDHRFGSASGGNPNPADGTGGSLWIGHYLGDSKEDSLDFQASGPIQLLGRQHDLIIGGGSYRRNWSSDNTGAQTGYTGTIANFYEWTGDIPEPLWNRDTYGGDMHWDRREQSLYGALRLNPHDDLKVILGARVIRYKSLMSRFWYAEPERIKKTELVPYAGVVYNLTSQLSVYASYTSIFNPETYQDVTGRTLDPMEGTNMEVGLKGEFFDKRLNVSLALFRVKQDNYAKSTPAKTPDGNTAYEAVDGVKTRGFELEVVGHLTPQWQVHGGFTHKVARRDGAKIETITPENQFTLRSSYRFSGDLTGLTLGAGLRWESKSWENLWFDAGGKYVEYTIPSRAVADLMVNYQFNSYLSTSLNITNIFDKKYVNYMGGFYGTYAWGEPRRVAASVRYNF